MKECEAHNFDIRKHLLEYDDVANDQRKVIYEQRNDLLEGENVEEEISQMRFDVIENVIDMYIPRGSMDEMWDIDGLKDAFQHEFDLSVDIDLWLEQDKSLHEESLREKLHDTMDQLIKDKESIITSDLMRRVEKQIMLDVLDRHWKEHLAAMDQGYPHRRRHWQQSLHLEA